MAVTLRFLQFVDAMHFSGCWDTRQYSDKVRVHYKEITRFLTNKWKNEKNQHSLLEISGCMDKFSSIILQINGLYNHQINLIKDNSYIFMIPVLGNIRSGIDVSLNELCYR